MPTVTIVTNIFDRMSRAQVTALGMPDLRIVVVPHPISTKDEAGLDELARYALPMVLEAWSASKDGTSGERK